MANEQNNLGSVFGPTSDCLSLDELVIRLEGRHGEAERRRTESHVETCAHCRTELDLFREFESPTVRPNEQADVNWIAARLRNNPPYRAAQESWWKRLWTARVLAPASIALATALIVIGIAVQRPANIGPAPSPNGGGEVMRSQSVDLISPLGDQAQRPSELRWRAVPGASHYRVRILEVDRTEIWSGTSSTSSMPVPEAVRRQLAPLKTLMWQVTALDGAGNVLASSGTASFRTVSERHP